jgi:hypothetical protein
LTHAIHFIFKVIDTAIMFKNKNVSRSETEDPKKQRHSLKYLASKVLGQNIQQNERGHDSKEDALTALLLVKAFIDTKKSGKLLTY